jgi:hypothetical protein
VNFYHTTRFHIPDDGALYEERWKALGYVATFFSGYLQVCSIQSSRPLGNVAMSLSERLKSEDACGLSFLTQLFVCFLSDDFSQTPADVPCNVLLRTGALSQVGGRQNIIQFTF